MTNSKITNKEEFERAIGFYTKSFDYIKPIRGVHLRVPDSIIQLCPTSPRSNYYNHGKCIEQKVVLCTLYEHFCHQFPESYSHVLSPQESRDLGRVSLKQTDRGYPDQLDILIDLNPELESSLGIQNLIKKYKTITFSLGLVPYHAVFLRSTSPEILQHIEPGIVTKVYFDKKSFRIRVDLPYFHKIFRDYSGLIFDEKHNVKLEKESESYNNNISLELD